MAFRESPSFSGSYAADFSDNQLSHMEFLSTTFRGAANRVINPQRNWKIPTNFEFEPAYSSGGIFTSDEIRRLFEFGWNLHLNARGFESEQIRSFIEMKYAVISGRLKP